MVASMGRLDWRRPRPKGSAKGEIQRNWIHQSEGSLEEDTENGSIKKMDQGDRNQMN